MSPLSSPVTPLLSVPVRLLLVALFGALFVTSIILSFGNAWWMIGIGVGAGGCLEVGRRHDRWRW